MDPFEAYVRLREACQRRYDLRHKGWPEHQDKLLPLGFEGFSGFCYIASHAFAAVVPDARVYQRDGKHYWNTIGDKIWDLTAEQFQYIYPYNLGRRVPKKVTGRVEELLKEADLWW